MYNETEEKVFIEVELSTGHIITEENKKNAAMFAAANKEQIYIEGVEFLAETMMIIRNGTGVEKDIEGIVTNKETGEKYRVLFEKL